MSAAVVLLSGGIDSTVCLFISRLIFDDVRALSIEYGQRHYNELAAAEKIATVADVPWKGIRFDALGEIGSSALVNTSNPFRDEAAVVPGRNIIFLTLAAAYALEAGAEWIVAGMSGADQVDFPDCRPAFMESMQNTLKLGLEYPVQLLTPLLRYTKAETLRLAKRLPVPCLDALDLTVTCYEGKSPGCGVCMACRERAKGIEESGLNLRL